MSFSLAAARRCNNQLLTRLSDDELVPLLAFLKPCAHLSRDVLLRQGEKINHVYFPSGCVHSCMIYTEDGYSVEVGTIGNEGFTGTELLLDATIALETVVCQVPGNSLHMSVHDFHLAMGESRAFSQILRRSAQAYLAQVSQTAACNRLHSMEPRFARWLLITHDRVEGNEFELKQEFLASMLGVQRPSISLIAGQFQQAGMIRYARGRMQILDRQRLEETACECYVAVRNLRQRLLGEPHG